MKPWQRRHWCLGQITSEFLWRMEDVLDLYEQPYDERWPVVCLDERPCQLLGEGLAPIPMKPGQVQRSDYEYVRNGVATLFVAVEPLTGKRLLKVTSRRTRQDYAEFMHEVSQQWSGASSGAGPAVERGQQWSGAERICLVQDNLNTHTPGSFYEAFSAEEAFGLASCFEMHYTPKKASWLNMAEIEISAIARQCLDRRIASEEHLAREIAAYSITRQGVRLTWRFTKNDARNKLARHYPKST
jgi:hypothetical protein